MEILGTLNNSVRTAGIIFKSIENIVEATQYTFGYGPTSADLRQRVANNDMEKTIALLEEGVDINEPDKNGNTPLHTAVMMNNEKMVRLLLRKGARADILDGMNLAPVHFAIREGYMKCLKELLDSSINIQDGHGNTPLGLAIEEKNPTIIDLLLGHAHVDLTKKDKNGYSAFHLVAAMGDAETAKKILRKKSDIADIEMDNGYSALHLASENNRIEFVKFLIEEAKVKLDVKTRKGFTPLMLASRGDHIDIVKMLVERGVDINSQNGDKETCLHCVIRRKLDEMVNEGNEMDIIRHLVENGAKLSIQNKEGKTPLDYIDDESLKKDLKKMANKRKRLRKKKRCVIV